jgi:hypothetical protein
VPASPFYPRVYLMLACRMSLYPSNLHLSSYFLKQIANISTLSPTYFMCISFTKVHYLFNEKIFSLDIQFTHNEIHKTKQTIAEL